MFGVNQIVPEIGITATPVIDPAAGALYVTTTTKDVEAGVEHVVQELHALDVATGAEMFGGPVVIADTTVHSDGTYTYNSGPSVLGTGAGSTGDVLEFNALTQNERAALVLDNGVVYLSYSSHGDVPPNHGWILGYDAQTLKLAAVFNATPNGSDGTIWGSGEGLAVDPQGDLYFVTGNGTFETTLDPATGFPIDGDYGDSVVKIGVDPGSSAAHPNVNGWGLKVLDYFTPSDQQSLNDHDTDFGSGGPLLLPATASGPQVVLAAGKEGTIFVLDTDTGKMGEFHADHNSVYQEIQGQIGGMWASPVYFDGSVYYGPYGDAIKALPLEASNMLGASPTSHSTEVFGYPGTNPAISADGAADGILWSIDATAAGSDGPAVLRAYDASNLANELYSSMDDAARDQAGSAVKFSVPTIADGMVFVGGESSLTVFGLLTGVPAPATLLALTTEPPAFVEPGGSFGLTVTVEFASGGVDSAFSGQVSISLADNPGGALLGGTTSVTASGGVATFSGLTINQPGAGYRIEAVSGSSGTILSAPVTVAFAPRSSGRRSCSPVAVATGTWPVSNLPSASR